MLRDMKVALQSNDFSAGGISFTRNRKPGFVEVTAWLIWTSDAASALDRFDTATDKQSANLMLMAYDGNTPTNIPGSLFPVTLSGVFSNPKGGYISDVHFQKCSSFSITIFFTFKISTKIFYIPKGGPDARPLNTPWTPSFSIQSRLKITTYFSACSISVME